MSAPIDRRVQDRRNLLAADRRATDAKWADRRQADLASETHKAFQQLHAIARCAGLPLGRSVTEEALAAVEKVVAERDELLAALRQMSGLAEEAIELRAESLDEEDHEMLPAYREQLAATRAVIARATGSAS